MDLVFPKSVFLRTLRKLAIKVGLEGMRWQRSAIDAVQLAVDHSVATLLESKWIEYLLITTGFQ